MSYPTLNLQKLNGYKKYSTLSLHPGHLLQILGRQESYSRVLHLMRIVQFRTQTNPEIKMSYPTLNLQKLNGYKKYSTLSLHPGHLLQILGRQESYSRVLHLMRIVQFRTQTNPEIKMSYPTLNLQKLNGYKKYSTLSLHPGHLLQILGRQESYSRVLHLMRILQFRTQTNLEIKMS